MNSATTKLLFAAALILPACTGSDSGTTDTSADTDTGGNLCEPDSVNACACPDGSGSTQICAADGQSYGACECGAATTGATTGTSSVGTSDSGSGTTSAGTTTTAGSTGGSSSSTGGSTGGGSSTGGPVGQPPEATINHPGEGEDRKVDVAIPFIGVGNDAEDGALSGASMQWFSDQEGNIGQGESFDAALSTLGPHVITLEVTDSDANVTSDMIMINIVP